MKIISNIRVGKPDVKPSQPSHIPGVRQGNQVGSEEQEPGLYPIKDDGGGAVGNRARATARFSTGVNPEKRNPIDPRMPNLPPP